MRSLSGGTRRAHTLVGAIALSAGLLAPGNAAATESPLAASPVVRYADVLRTFNPRLTASQSRDIAVHVLLLSGYYSLDPRLLVAIVGVESNWRSGAVSPSGAQGLGQLMPATADGLSVLAFDAYENLDGTARYLRRLMQRYAGLGTDERYRMVLAGYNAGTGAVSRFGGIPPYPQTQAYVTRVMTLWHRLELTLPATAPQAVVAARVQPRRARDPRPAGGSVAGFMQLEAQAWAELPAAQPRGLRGWVARVMRGRRD